MTLIKVAQIIIVSHVSHKPKHGLKPESLSKFLSMSVAIIFHITKAKETSCLASHIFPHRRDFAFGSEAGDFFK